MFQKILVPLDGSDRAERAIPIAAHIAHACGGSIILLRVLTHSVDMAVSFLQPPETAEKHVETHHAQATTYLHAVAVREVLTHIPTTLEIADSMPAQTILSTARLQAVDLIVMCSHGMTGFKRWALGSVAQIVAHASDVPVLVLREDGGSALPLTPNGARSMRMLVALDGSPLAETVLFPAGGLCAALSAPAQGHLHLTHIVPFSHQDEQAEEAITRAHAYLCSVAQKFQEGEMAHLHLLVSSSVAFGGDVADTLIKIAETGIQEKDARKTQPCHMIALATHGREGADRWIMGSITERVLEATRLPTLIVRPQISAG